MTLIDRDEIVKVAEHAFKEWNLAMAAADGECEINRVFKMKELCRAVKAVAMAAPIIDAAPVVHGEWMRDHGTYGKLICSVCSARAGYKAKETEMGYNIYNVHPSDFCPNCGARMEVRDD